MHKKKTKRQPIYCSGDLKQLEGCKVLKVSADKSENVAIKFVNETGHMVKIHISNIYLNGEDLTYTEWQTAPHSNTNKKRCQSADSDALKKSCRAGDGDTIKKGCLNAL